MKQGISGAATCLLLVLATSTSAEPHKSEPVAADRSSIAAFNNAFAHAIRTMNNAAVLSLWEENGVALLPNTAPIRGKADMGAMLQRISSDHSKATMASFANECFDIEISGHWGSEWCLEHQVVSEPGHPNFDSWGKLLLVLHRRPSGEWRLSREMWNQASPPNKATIPATSASSK